MREIKFRAWDKDEKSMYKVMSLTFRGIEYGYSVKITPKVIENRTLHNFKLMQYSGINDKNDKEIYEGDIFQCKSRQGKDMQGEVYFEEGCFKIKYGYQKPPEGERKDYFLSSVISKETAKEIEIIGNVFENPELLEQVAKCNAQ
jgi:uncharacterized phage protein (TIGR01671 family)